MTKKEPQQSSSKPTYIYIVGRGHSGSTLLTLLLGRHKSILAMGELQNLSLQCFRDERTRWVGLCSCGQRPFNCEFWYPVLDEISVEFGINLKNNPFAWPVSDVGVEEEYRSNAIYRSPISLLRNRFWRVLRNIQYSKTPMLSSLFGVYRPQKRWAANRSFVAESIARRGKVRAVVDASKDYLGMCDMYWFSELPVKILFITRDCRGNCWSIAKQSKSPGERRPSIIRGAKNWVSVNRRMHKTLQNLPSEDWMHVRYEDLCHDPVSTLSRILEFVDLSYSDHILDGEQQLQHTIAGNKIRLTDRTLRVKEDTTWRDNLTAEELKIIHRICAPFATTLNYEM